MRRDTAPPALDPLEIATGIVYGVGSGLRLPPAADAGTALAAAVGPALRRGRCFVSFSGGRDSSAVLAAAAHVARREGLDLPVPLTIRARHAPAAEESDWQECVVAHLGLDDWVRIDVDGELDAVGPYARAVLAHHGLLWPFNVHFHVPMLVEATGGTLLTGIGGDELWKAATARRVRRRRHALRIAPSRLQRSVLARREPVDFPWLTSAARRAARLAGAAEAAAEPWTARDRLSWWRSLRYLAVGTRSLAAVAVDAGATIEHPLLSPTLWGALAAVAPRAGFSSSDAALAAVAGELLPQELVARRTKAGFDDVFFADQARALAERWDGGGVPEDLVDVAALRAGWRSEAPDPHTLTLLQAAALASAGDGVQHAIA
jgi:asparagine synthetase B (glutamine-hydrolysing)